MFKNTSGQKLTVYAFDSTTNLPKTGDAANLTAYRDLDDGGVTVLTDTSATEKDATNAKGFYIFDLTQAETNGDKILFTCKSSTANIVVLAMPAVVYTLPATGILAPATAGRTLVVDASGLADANMVKMGPTGSGTAQTARDIGASVLLSSGTGTGQLKLASGYVAMTWADIAAPTTTVNLSGTTVKTATDVETDTADIQSRLPAALGANGNLKADVRDINGTTIAGTSTRVADSFVAMFNVATPVFTVASVNQTGDSFARLTGTGAVTFASLTISGATTFTGAITATNASNAVRIGTFTVDTNAIAWNASWDTEVQSEVNDALVANFLDQYATGTYTVQASPAPTTTVFRVNTSWATGKLNDQLFKFRTGTLASEAKPISSSVQIGGSIMELTFDEPFTAAPTAGDEGIAIVTHVHPISQIQSGLATSTELAKVPKSDSNVSWNATAAAQIQSEATDALNAYDPPTRTEATADKDAILTQLPAAPVKNATFTYVIKMVDTSGDPVTGLTVGFTRSIDGAAFGAGTGTVTEISTGHYKVAASAADMNGDVVAHRFTGTGAKDLTVVFKTVS